MFNFKKVKEAVKKMTSAILTASLSLGMFSVASVKATGSSNEEPVSFIILGNEKSGKTKIINRMVLDKFEENYRATIVIDFITKIYNFNGNQYGVHIWGASGQERYHSSIETYIGGNGAIILAVSYDDEKYSESIKEWLDLAEKALEEENSTEEILVKPVKVVLTKSDVDKKFAKGDVEEYLRSISEEDYKNIEIDKMVIETSAKDNTGINHKEDEERNPETCLEDYLLNLFDQQKQSSNIEDTKQSETNSFGKNNNKGQSIFQKSKGFVKKHPVTSCTIGTLVTGIVVTPLVIFRNKIIKEINSIFGKNQNKKPVAKRIKTTN